MSRDLYDLADRLEKKVVAIEKAASEAAKGAALEIVQDLAESTPVDTSMAVSNWQVTLGSPTFSQIPPHYPGDLGSTRAISSAETVANAKAALSAKKPGQPIYITNNTDYIRTLNDGSSAQAPAGFIERAIMIGRMALSKFRVKG